MHDTSDLARSAERCADEMGMPAVDDVATRDPIEQVTSDLIRSEEAWRLREGMRLQFVRKVMLKVLKPFAEREQKRADLSATLLILLSDEIRRLRSRIEELEAAAGSSADDRGGQ